MKETRQNSVAIFSLSKIKNTIQCNEKLGKIALAIPSMISKILELFLIDLFSEIIFLLKKKKINTIKRKHFSYVIRKYRRFNNFDYC